MLGRMPACMWDETPGRHCHRAKAKSIRVSLAIRASVLFHLDGDEVVLKPSLSSAVQNQVTTYLNDLPLAINDRLNFCILLAVVLDICVVAVEGVFLRNVRKVDRESTAAVLFADLPLNHVALALKKDLKRLVEDSTSECG